MTGYKIKKIPHDLLTSEEICAPSLHFKNIPYALLFIDQFSSVPPGECHD
jgi:hypothetical protein